MVKLRELKPHPKNPRTHPPGQIEALAKAIADLGFLDRIVIDSKKRVLSGHGRIEAAKLLGMTEVPYDVADHLTENQKLAYMLADNKLALMGGWNPIFALEHLETLRAGGYDLSIVPFSDEEIARMVEDVDRARLAAIATGSAPNATPGEPDDDEDEESGDEEGDEVPFTVLMATSDRAKVYSALQFVKERDNINLSSQALLTIIEEWRNL